jgi:hypothetical protein
MDQDCKLRVYESYCTVHVIMSLLNDILLHLSSIYIQFGDYTWQKALGSISS